MLEAKKTNKEKKRKGRKKMKTKKKKKKKEKKKAKKKEKSLKGVSGINVEKMRKVETQLSRKAKNSGKASGRLRRKHPELNSDTHASNETFFERNTRKIKNHSKKKTKLEKQCKS